MEKIIVVSIIENSKKEMLLQKKTLDYPLYPGVWCFVGGGAKSEDLHKEIQREIKEELGIKLSVKFLFGQRVISKMGKSMFYVFLSRLDKIKDVKIGEGAGVAFFAKKELRELRINPETKKILNTYFKKKF